jgi:nucleoside-diphosphate-sugar epimerase
MRTLRLNGFEFDTLVGHTGFVGRNLNDSFSFRHRFNSVNSDNMRGLRTPGMICACLYAEKWRANNDAKADLEQVRSVFETVSAVRADAVILISTIDIYDPPYAVDESCLPDPEQIHPYGRHRLLFERWMSERFGKLWTIRLPGLFGPHLKKNLIFDLAQNRLLDQIHPDGCLQWMHIGRLPEILSRAVMTELSVLNVVSEPISTLSIRDVVRPGAQIGVRAKTAPNYDVRTAHSQLFGRSDGYVFARQTVIDDLRHATAEMRRG